MAHTSYSIQLQNLHNCIASYTVEFVGKQLYALPMNICILEFLWILKALQPGAREGTG